MQIGLDIGRKVDYSVMSASLEKDHPFGTGPHSVAFTDSAIRSMAISSTATRDDGAERGFNFCVNPKAVVKKSVTPGQRLPEKAWPWAVLNAADRCVGDRCSVQINKGCPDTFETRVDHITGEEEKTNILPGMEWGTHHTHPNRKDVRASVGDKLLMVDDAVYQRGPAFSCITARPEVWDVPDSWWNHGDRFFTDDQKADSHRIRNEYGPARPTKCFAIPDNKLPSMAEAQWWRLKYNANIRPYYNEWKRLGKAPGREYKDYDSFRKAYDEIDEQTDALIAEVQFSDLKGTGELEDKSTVTQNMSPGYFGVYQVATSQLPPGEFQLPPPLPKPRVTPIAPIKSSFDEIFESLANCEQRTWAKKHWGTKPKTMSEEDFKEIIATNDLEIRHPDGTGKSIQEICRELSDLGDLWI